MSSRRKRLSHQMHALTPSIRFKKYETITGGLLVTSLAGTGAWIGYREGKAGLESAQDHMKSIDVLERAIWHISDKTISEMSVKKPNEKCENKLIEKLKEKGVKESEMQGKLELIEGYARVIVNSELRQLLGTDYADTRLSQARENVLKYSAYGGCLGLSLGILFAYIAMVEMRKSRINHMREKEKAKLKEIIRNQEEQKAKQKEEKALNKISSGTFNAVPFSESMEMRSEESCVSQEDKIKRKGVSLEKTIRRICGKKCSMDVADAIATCLPYSITEWIIENPGTLKQVLEENKDILDANLEPTGWSVDQVLNQIQLKEFQRTGESDATNAQPQRTGKNTGGLNIRIMHQLKLLKKARENLRGIDRKDLHELVTSAGFSILPGHGEHPKVEYRGEPVRTENGRPVIIVRKSSGDLPYGTVAQVLDHLIIFLEKKIRI